MKITSKSKQDQPIENFMYWFLDCFFFVNNGSYKIWMGKAIRTKMGIWYRELELSNEPDDYYSYVWQVYGIGTIITWIERKDVGFWRIAIEKHTSNSLFFSNIQLTSLYVFIFGMMSTFL